MTIITKLVDKYNLITKPAKASIWFVMCYVIQRGLQFLSMPIFTRIMSQEDYGIYSVFLSWFNVVCIFTSLNIYSGTFNKAMVKYEEKRNEYISSVQSLTTLTTLLFAVFIIIFRDYISSVTGFSNVLMLLMIIHLFFFPTLQYWSQELRFRYEYKPLVIVTVFNSVLSTVLGIIVVSFTNDKSTSLIGVVVGVQAIICVCIYLHLWKKGRCIFNKEYWRWSIGLAVPLVPHYLSEVLLSHSDRLMISRMCGNAEAGIYNIVYQISMVMTIIRTGINGAFAPWLYYSIKNRKYEDICRVTKGLTIMMAIMSAFFMIIGPEILKIAAPVSYYEAVIDIPAIMMGGFFIYVYVLFVYVETYYEEKNYVSIASILSTILNVILNWMFIPRYGYLIAGYTTMFSYMAMSIMHFVFLKKVSKRHIEINVLFDYKFILIVSILVILFGFITIKLYNFTILRYVLIFALIVGLYLKRSLFINLIKSIKKK